MNHEYLPLCSGCGEEIHPGDDHFDATDFFPRQRERVFVHDRCVELLVERYRDQLVSSCTDDVDDLLSAIIRETVKL